MPISPEKAATMIVTAALGTWFLRGLPFLLFRQNEKPSPRIVRLGDRLPMAIMLTLIIFSLRHVSFYAWPGGYLDLLCVFLVVLLQLLFKNTLLSIGLGTAAYMLLLS